MYNLTGITNGTDIAAIVATINTQSHNWYGGTLLLTIFVIIFILFVNYDKRAVFVADSLVTLLIAFLLNGIGIISMKLTIYPFLLFIASLIIYIWWD